MDKELHQAVVRNATAICQAYADQFRPDFLPWLGANVHVYLAFESLALRIFRSGRNHYSHRAICAYLRMETDLKENGSQFKLDATHIGDLGRLFIHLNPQCQGFFTFRKSNLRNAA